MPAYFWLASLKCWATVFACLVCKQSLLEDRPQLKWPLCLKECLSINLPICLSTPPRNHNTYTHTHMYTHSHTQHHTMHSGDKTMGRGWEVSAEDCQCMQPQCGQRCLSKRVSRHTPTHSAMWWTSQQTLSHENHHWPVNCCRLVLSTIELLPTTQLLYIGRGTDQSPSSFFLLKF